MIRDVYGKIGGGKTYYSVAFEILEELVYGERIVVTNVALDLPEIAALIAKRYPQVPPVDLHSRVRILSIDEMAEFFRYRHHGCTLDVPTLEEWRKGANVCYDFDPLKGPEKDSRGNYVHLLPSVFYVIDEAHVKFDARGWMTQGPHVTFYNSQHRKLNDEVLFITQFPELVDKRLKGFAQEHIYIENLGLQRVFSYFRPPAYFVAKSYLRERTSTLQDVPQWTKRFRFDPEIGKCYDTSAGVGIKGRKKPETRKKKGVSLGWAALGLCLAGWALIAALDWLPRKVVGKVHDVGTSAAKEVSPAAKPAVTVDLAPPQRPAQTFAPVPVTATPPPAILPPLQGTLEPSTPLYVRGMVWNRGRYLFNLSDGRVLDERTGLVAEHTSSFVRLVDGSILWVLQRPREPKAPEPVPVELVPEKDKRPRDEGEDGT